MPRIHFLILLIMLGALCAWPARLSAQLNKRVHAFAELPSRGLAQRPFLPTPNRELMNGNREGFAAKTITNEAYGMPGWTRGQGSRFHKGVDICPVEVEPGKGTVRIDYYDPRRNRDISRNEPVVIPKDPIFSILDGTVVVANEKEERSGYGRYLMIEHVFADGTPFISMYAHLSRLAVAEGETVRGGQRIGWMGNTSSNAGGRIYLKAIPHCHFEVGRVIDPGFPKTREARRLHPPILGGKYDPRNIQPYDPVDFLLTYRARPRSLGKANPEDSRESPAAETTTEP